MNQWTIRARRTRRALQAGRTTGSLIITAAFAVLFLVALGVSIARGDWTTGGCSLLLLGMAAGSATAKSEETEEEDFRNSVLKGVEALTTKADKFQEETKKSLGELTAFRESQTAMAEKVAAIERASLAMKAERRFSGQARSVNDLIASEEKAVTIMQQVLKAVGRDDVFEAFAKKNPIAKALVTKDLSSSSGLGAATMNNDLFREVFDLLLTYGAWSSLGVRRLGTRTTKFPIKTARPKARVILTEGAPIPADTRYSGTQVNLTAEMLAVLLSVPQQLIDDDEIDLVGEIMNDFLQSLAELIDNLAFIADGTADADNGGMTGLFNFGTAITAATGHVSVATTTVDDYVKCLTGVSAAVLSRQPKWWMHPTQIARVITVKDANGRPIFLNAMEAPSYGAIGTVLGYPVIPVGVAPSADGTSKKIAAFGDGNAFVVGVRKDYDFAASDEPGFTSVSRYFRGVSRGGVKGRDATGIAILSTAAS